MPKKIKNIWKLGYRLIQGSIMLEKVYSATTSFREKFEKNFICILCYISVNH